MPMSVVLAPKTANIPIELWADVIEFMEDSGQLRVEVEVLESGQGEIDQVKNLPVLVSNLGHREGFPPFGHSPLATLES